ncbi:ankyrin repeat-containing protein NPR4-like [Salvia miltiorrhiza]|uniref:ankyrin repeat-containing protein NPR4-like n=1 Tax=Salvia miltiorrhiza TaxID=226208 RepID=UPI0025ACE550|nr:ankyrin repeat-containing protein NPR4-like [Salvia miltiorrhiza]
MAAELYDAILRGDVRKFREVVQQDPYLVESASFACSRNVLHIAILWKRVAIVEEVLKINPQLARDLDSQQSSPLHIAVAKGSLEIVKKLLSVAPEACWWRDCHDMNPIHIAAMNGHVDILEELLQECPLPAMERLHRGQTVLHLCVKHGQLDALKVLVNKLGEFVYAVDDDGETLSHLAVRCNQLEILRYLWESNKIIRRKRNSMGKTALEILDESPPATTPSYSEMRRILRIIPSEYMFETNMDNVMIVVAILIATMAFQNSVSPPGGVWQDDTPSHKAGQAVIAYTHPHIYRDLVFANNMAFYLSFLVIFLITFGSVVPFISSAVVPAMWWSIMYIILSYGSSMKVISPNTFHTPLIGVYIFYAGILIAMLLGLKRSISWIFQRLGSWIFQR